MMKNNFILLIFLIFTLLSTRQLFAKGNISYQHIKRLNKINNQYLNESSWELRLLDNKDHFQYNSKVRYTAGPLGAIVSIGEVYYSNSWNSYKLWVGKKILNWEHSEKTWNLGILNPQEGFNLLENNREGLLSLGMSKAIGNCEVSVAISPFNIPQLNPSFITKDNQIIGKNEWSVNPPSRVIFNNQDTPVEYEVLTPKLSKILLTPMFAGNVTCGKKIKTSVYFISKAENQIRISANGAFDAAKGRVFVQAKPFINKHTIFGTSIGKSWNNQKITLGFLKTVPSIGKGESFKIEKLKIEPVYMNESNITLGYKFVKNSLAISIDYLHTIEGRSSPEGVFTKKSYWLDAIAMEFEYRINEKLQVSTNYKYDFVKKDMLNYTDIRYSFNRHYLAKLGYQILDSPNDSSFWANYRSNDAVYSEFTYLF